MADNQLLTVGNGPASQDHTDDLSEILLSQFSEFIAQRMGLHFPKKQWSALERGIRAVSGELGLSDASALLRRLSTAPISRSDIETLAGHLTVGETFFWRDQRVLEILRDEIVPGVISKRDRTDRRLRIWSAGCSSGEEPYTIAVLLREMGDAIKNWNISILATDINANAVRKASEGVYTEWSFRDSPQWLRTKYFKEAGGGQFQIHDPVKELVSFAYLNLVEDVYPSLLNNTNALDIIVCRNVLMYFVPGPARAVLERFYRCLVDGGWLIIGPCEATQEAARLFTPVNFRDAVLYRKDHVKNAGRDASQFKTSCEAAFGPSITESESELSSPLSHEFASSALSAQVPAGTDGPTIDTAKALYEQGLYAVSENALRAIINGRSMDTGAEALLCRTLANQGKLEEALALTEQAIALNKCEAELHYLRASILQEKGDFDGAIRSINRALYLEPDFVLGYFVLGNLAWRRDKDDEARRHFETVLSLLTGFRPDDPLPLSEGITALRLKEIIGTMLGGEK